MEKEKQTDAKHLLCAFKFRTMNLFQDYTAELSMIDIENPDFKNTSKVHDWRNYVPYDWQKNWHLFTERERQIIAVMSQSQADKEEWD